MNVKHELQSIISGIGDHSAKNLIEAAAHYIRESKKTSGTTQEFEFTKEQETKELINWINQHNLWFKDHDESSFFQKALNKEFTFVKIKGMFTSSMILFSINFG